MLAIYLIKPALHQSKNIARFEMNQAATNHHRHTNAPAGKVGAQVCTSRLALAIDINMPMATPSVAMAVPP